MIELNAVDVRLGQKLILSGFTHTFPAGSLQVVTGPSGIGKTTLLQTIAGLLPLEGGTVSVCGCVTDRPGFTLHPAKRRMGFVFQTPALWPHLSVRQNILYGVSNLPDSEAQNRLEKLCEALSIGALLNDSPGRLSGGQARRVSLARSLITQPACLLLDEPFNHLDAALKADIRMLLAKLKRLGETTVVLVSHEPADIGELADRVLTFHENGLS